MKIHRVKKGEDLPSISLLHGISDWQAVYDHPANKRLKEFRKNPFQLVEEDVVYIPDVDPQIHKLATNQSHTIKIEIPKAHFSVKLQDQSGEALGGVKYRLIIGDGDDDPGLLEKEGSTGGDGLVEEEIPVHKQTAILEYWPDANDDSYSVVKVFDLGAMDCSAEKTGIEKRLYNLGYLDEDPEYADIDLADFEQALGAFKADYGLQDAGLEEVQQKLSSM